INTGYGTSDLPELDVFLNARPGLSKLRSLDCCIGHKSDEISNYQNTMNLLRNWPVQSSNLSKMCVSIYEDRITPNDLISSIVKAQRNLKEFKFAGIGTFTQNVISALKYHSHSLTTLKLWMLVLDGISFDGLVSLEKLESLDIQWCEGISIDHCGTLSDSSFHLTSLSIWDNPSSPDITATLITKAGKALRDLKTDMITREMIEVANKYCPNITHLCIKIRNENHDYLFPWIKSLRLDHLDFFSHENDASDGIRLLGEYIPLTVTYLNLDYATYTPRSFKYFLNVFKTKYKALEYCLDVQHPYTQFFEWYLFNTVRVQSQHPDANFKPP
ncbi:19246_t:CDS:2, partial [Racocetra fulgida]